MTIKRGIPTIVLAAVSFTAATAATLSLPLCLTSFTAVAKTKLVTFSVRDDTAYAVQLHCNSRAEDTIIEPGRTISLSMAVGDALVAANSTPRYPAGTRLVLVSSNLEDATVVLH